MTGLTRAGCYFAFVTTLCFLEVLLSAVVLCSAYEFEAFPITKLERQGKQIGIAKVSFDAPLVCSQNLVRENANEIDAAGGKVGGMTLSRGQRKALLMRLSDWGTRESDYSQSKEDGWGTFDFSVDMMGAIFNDTSVSAVVLMLPADLLSPPKINTSGLHFGNLHGIVAGKETFLSSLSRDKTDASPSSEEEGQMGRKSGEVYYAVPPAVAKALVSLEHFLLRNTIRIPLYLAPETIELQAACKAQYKAANNIAPWGLHQKEFSLRRIIDYIFLDEIYLSAKTPEFSRITSPIGENIWGWVMGKSIQDTHQNYQRTLPTIAIVTHMDSFALAPGLAFGASTSASGIIAFMELARIFSSFASSVGIDSIPYNILFLATSGATANFRGIQQWLISHSNQKTLSNIEFALCLDTLIPSPVAMDTAESKRTWKLHFASTPKKHSIIGGFSDRLEAVASRKKISLQTVVKKIKIFDIDVPWQHEWLVKYNVTSATLSLLSEAAPFLKRSSLIDQDFSTKTAQTLKDIIELLAEALALHMLNLPSNSQLLESIIVSDSSFIVAWLQLLSSATRVFPQHERQNKMQALVAIQETMKKYLSELEVQGFSFLPTATEIKAAQSTVPTSSRTPHIKVLKGHMDALQQLGYYAHDHRVIIQLKRSKGLLFGLLFLMVTIAYLAVFASMVDRRHNGSFLSFFGKKSSSGKMSPATGTKKSTAIAKGISQPSAPRSNGK